MFTVVSSQWTIFATQQDPMALHFVQCVKLGKLRSSKERMMRRARAVFNNFHVG
jgi:hypothetical protein